MHPAHPFYPVRIARALILLIVGLFLCSVGYSQIASNRYAVILQDQAVARTVRLAREHAVCGRGSLPSESAK